MFTDSGSQAICDGLIWGGGGGVQRGWDCRVRLHGGVNLGGMIGSGCRRGLVGAGLFVFDLLLAVGVGWV